MKNSPIVFEPFLRFIISFYNESQRLIHLSNSVSKNENYSKEEIELLHESFLVKISAEWEFLIHNILAYSISLDTTCLAEKLCLDLPQRISHYNAYAILNGANFISIRDADELVSKAKDYIVEKNNPFKKNDRTRLKKFEIILAMRNYIAHKSKASKIKLLKHYSQPDKIYSTKVFIEPGTLLTKEIKDNLGTYTVANLLYGSLAEICIEIWRNLDVSSYDFVFNDYNDLEKKMLDGLMVFDSTALKDEFFNAIQKMEYVFSILESQIGNE